MKKPTARNKTPVCDYVRDQFKKYLEHPPLQRFGIFHRSTELILQHDYDNAIRLWGKVIDDLKEDKTEKLFANFLWNYYFPSLKPIWKDLK